MAPINRGLLTSAVLTIIGTFFVAQFYVHDLKVFWAVAHRRGPRPGGQPDHRVLHLDRDRPGPRHRRVGPHRAGHHRPVRHQLRAWSRRCRPSSPSSSPSWWPSASGNGNIQLELYLVSLTGLGLLSDDRHRGVRGHLRPRLGQRRRHRRDERRVPRRAGADHGQPGRGGQHHQGHHQGLRHRLGGHRLGGPVRQLHPDHRRERQGRRLRHRATPCSPPCRRRSSTWPTRRRSSGC